MSKINWEKRIRRAADLKHRNQASREVLDFYEHVLEVQRRIFEALPAPTSPLPPAQSFRQDLNVEQALQWLPSVLEVVRTKAPAKLATEAHVSRQLRKLGAGKS